MFSLRDFIKKGLLGAVGRMPDYRVILNAVGWHEKGVLEEQDLEQIDTKIQSQYPEEMPETDADFRSEIPQEAV